MTSKGGLGAKNRRTKVHIERVAHSWAVPTQLQVARCFSTAGAGSAASSLRWLVPGKPANLSLLCHLSRQPGSPSTLVLSLHGSCPIVQVLSGCPLSLFWLFGCALGCGDGRVGACRSCKHYPAQDHTTDLCSELMMLSVLSGFFSPFLVIPNILLAFLTPAQPWPVIFSELATMLRSFSRAVMADLEPLIMHV